MKVIKKKRFMIVAIVIALIVTTIAVALVTMRVSWQNKTSQQKIDSVQQQIDKNPAIKSASILVVKDGKITACISKGGMDEMSPMATASISKLYNDAIMFSLIDKGDIKYDTLIVDVLGDSVRNINVINGVDYSDQITIRHLIDQTSGLADYETDKMPDGSVLIDQLSGNDKSIDYEESLRLTKQLGGKFIPGAESKAYYSNMNANLLAKVAETITGKPITELFDSYIYQPLKLKQTGVGVQDDYQSFYSGDTALKLPKYLSSSPAAGGVISTNQELTTFTQAFMTGKLFDKKHLSDPTFRSIQFFPMKYGSGMMSLSMPGIMSPILPAPEIIGHSGSTGSFAYYHAESNTYITGTINQANAQPYEYIYRLIDSAQ